MSAAGLLSRLEGVRHTGSARWVARCPAHKDRRASLSIRELEDGRVLVHDFAGCDVEAVLAAAGLAMEDLFPPSAPDLVRRAAVQRPYSARDLAAALAGELRVVWVLLADVAAGKPLGPAERQRAAKARERCLAVLDELQHAG